MMKLSWVVLVMAVGLSGFTLVASAAGTKTTGEKVVRLHDPLEALAMDGRRVAYDVSSDLSKNPNRVLVWNLSTGRTTKVSGRQTGGADGVTGGHVSQLAIAGTQVSWLVQSASNEEEDDDLYSSSLLKPRERHVAGEVRSSSGCGAGATGPQACVGTWLGGLVGSGNRILVNRWMTDTTGAITKGGLYALDGTRLQPFATGAEAVEAVAADSNRVAVLQWQWAKPATTIHVYSSTRRSLFSVTPAGQPKGVVLSGHNLIVLEPKGKLALYDARTGLLRKTFTLHGNPHYLQALAVQGNIAVYSTPVRYYAGRDAPSESAIRALNLSTGKDRPLGRLPQQITLASIDSTGVVYTNDLWTAKNGYRDELVFLPFKHVAAAVS
jgi:hypothetical protein